MIHGASSSGKTALSQALQRRLEEPFWHFSIDVLREGGALPMDRIRSGEFAWPALRPAFFDGFHRCLPVLAEAGNNLIVEHIIESEEWMGRLVSLLSHIDVFFVVLQCPLAELEQREIARGDRRIGEARRDFQDVPEFAACDLALDSTRPVKENAKRLISSWEARERPTAFEKIGELDSRRTGP